MVGIGQSAQPLPALARVLVEIALVQPAPGGAVAVFQHNPNINAPLSRPHQRLSDGRQAQLLHGHKAVCSGGIDGINHHLFEVVAIAPLAIDGAAVTPSIAVVERHGNAVGQLQVFCCSAQQLPGLAAANA